MKNIIEVLSNRKSFMKIIQKEGNYFAIDVKDIIKEELKELEEQGYKIKLFNYKWIKKPYYSIWK